MEPLSLSSSQSEKLVEMIKCLFPEHTEVEITSSFPYYNCNSLQGLQLGMPNLQFAWFKNPSKDAVSLIYEDKEHPCSRTLHWYQFVMTSLAERVFRLNLAKDIDFPLKDALKDFYWKTNLDVIGLGREHPIDLLYDVFLRRKINH